MSTEVGRTQIGLAVLPPPIPAFRFILAVSPGPQLLSLSRRQASTLLIAIRRGKRVLRRVSLAAIDHARCLEALQIQKSQGNAIIRSVRSIALFLRKRSHANLLLSREAFDMTKFLHSEATQTSQSILGPCLSKDHIRRRLVNINSDLVSTPILTILRLNGYQLSTDELSKQKTASGHAQHSFRL